LDTDTVDIAAPQAFWPHKLSVGEYFRMDEVGVLLPDARVELIEGQIFDMAPIGPRHQLIVDHFNEVFSSCLERATAIVRVQGSVRANDYFVAAARLIHPAAALGWLTGAASGGAGSLCDCRGG